MRFWDLRHEGDAVVGSNGVTVRYSELAERSDAFSDACPRVGEKNLGLLLCTNSISSIVAYLGALRTGQSIILLDAQLAPQLRANIVDAYNPQWIAAPSGTRLGDAYEPTPFEKDYSLFVHSSPACVNIHPNLAVLLSTSGSTGSPKLVRLSYDNIDSNAKSIAEYLNLRADERPITTLPLSYSYGLSVLNSHLACGGTVLVTDQSIVQRTFWEFFAAAGATSIAGVPYTYQMLLRYKFLSGRLDTMRTLTQAGGRLDPKYIQEVYSIALANGWKFFVMYGQTEATARISYVPPEVLGQKIGSIGRAIPGGHLEIDSSMGELVYKGPNVMLGYAESKADLAEGDVLGGELYTGDLGYQDSDGMFYVTGRVKRFLKLFGNRFNLDDVELYLQKTFGVQVACFGTDDRLNIALHSSSVKPADIARMVASTYQLHQSGVHVFEVREFPVTLNGKTDYQVLQRLYRGERPWLPASAPPYDEPCELKSTRMLSEISILTKWHVEKCGEYERILSALGTEPEQFKSLSDVPMLPVRLFKTLELRSIPASEIAKTLTSSGTSSQIPSQIFLDKATAQAQTHALALIMKSYLGSTRLPMGIFDHRKVLSNRHAFSARGAGILGFSKFGRDHTYLLNDNMELDLGVVETFLQRHMGEAKLLFGFTFVIWKYVLSVLGSRMLDFGDSILIHGGGWKKLSEEQVSNENFKFMIRDQLGIRHIYNYYGIVEQTGSIFMECEYGYLHVPSFSEAFVRSPETLEILPNGAQGLLELISIIPRSYPGHVLLTEDLGTIIGEDDCSCGRKGKYLVVHGRLANAELRGCSDTDERRPS